MRTHFLKIIDATNVTIDTNYDSQQVERIAGYSVQFMWVATSNSDITIKLQASNDNTNWDDISCATYNISSGSATTRLFNLPEVYYRFFRPVVVVTTGALTSLEATYFLKGY